MFICNHISSSYIITLKSIVFLNYIKNQWKKKKKTETTNPYNLGRWGEIFINLKQITLTPAQNHTAFTFVKSSRLDRR